MTTTMTVSPCGVRGRVRLTAGVRISLLAAAIALIAAALFVFVVRELPAVDAPFSIPWPVWVAAFAASEWFVVHVQVRRDSHSFSLTDLVLVAGLYLTHPAGLVVAQLAGVGLVLVLHRRQAGLKLVFNLAQYALCGCLATAVFAALAGERAPSDPGAWLAALAAVAVVTLMANGCIFVAISLSEGSPGPAELARMLRLSMPFALGVAAFGLLAAYLALQNPVALVLLVLPSALLISAYRAYTRAQEQQDHLRQLHEITSLLYNSENATTALTGFLAAVRGAFRAGVAEMLLLDADDGTATVSRSREGHEPIALLALEQPEGFERLLAAVTTGATVTTRTGLVRGAELDGYAGRRGLKDAMVSLLQTENRVHGLLLVGDRLGDVATFTRNDLALLETFARHVATSLERGRLEHDLRQVTALKEKLRHQAMHDALTGLPNRTLFLDRIHHAVHLAGRNGQWPAVLYLDLDGFKPVNDTFGHDAGDVLLRAFAARLHGCLRSADTAARLGGDEFAVVLHGPIDRAGVERVLGRIRSQLDLPIDLGAGRVATVGASIGVAFADAAHDVDTLIRHADVAMYTAKRAGRHRAVFYAAGLEETGTPQAGPAAALNRPLAQHGCDLS